MKVLFVTNMYPVADYAYYGIHVKEQIDMLAGQNGVTSDVYFIDGRKKKLNYLRSILAIRKKIKNNTYDLIHTHYGISGLFLLFFKPRVPTVITLHSGELFSQKGFINRFLQRNLTLNVIKRNKKIIVLNDETMSMLKTHKDKLVKLPCGTDSVYFNEYPLSKKAKTLTIGFPGNKERPEKNYPLFSAIISRLREEMQVEVVEFHNLTRKEVVDKLNEIDLLLMTSKVEGSPQIVKEAMACNCPVISTAVGDVADILQGVRHCYVIDSARPEDFIGPVKEICSLPADDRKSDGRAKLKQMGLNADTVANKLYKIYSELV